MKKILTVGILVCFISAVSSAVTVRGIDIDFVTIGNPGNPGDTRIMNEGATGYGAVDYTYKIGKYEITNGQWDTFVSATGAPTGNPNYAYDESAYWTGINVPTNKISWLEAAQFCNYLTSGDKYSGAYNFDPSGNFIGVDRVSAISTYGTTYVIPTEDEWYKAAYYTGSGYSLYANGTDTVPLTGTDTNYNRVVGQPWGVGVGNGTEEQNGTFDMMGNVWEWNETQNGSNRISRGGSYGYTLRGIQLSSSYRVSVDPYHETDSLGFRVASIPEPATLTLLALGGLALRKRK